MGESEPYQSHQNQACANFYISHFSIQVRKTEDRCSRNLVLEENARDVSGGFPHECVHVTGTRHNKASFYHSTVAHTGTLVMSLDRIATP